MKIFLSILALVSCAIQRVASGDGSGVESWRINPLSISQDVRNPLLQGPSASLTVLGRLQNIRNKLEEIEKKNTDLPVISPVRGPENQFQSINSFIDDLSLPIDNKEPVKTYEIRPLSMLEKIPVMPSSLNGYFMMFRLKQNVSDSVPTKSQSRFLGNEQQHFIQQINMPKSEPVVSQQQPFTIQRQVTSQQQSLNNQQMHVRRLNIQDQSFNHGKFSNDQQLGNQQLVSNREHHLNGPQISINQQQQANNQILTVNSQQLSSNERNILNNQQNRGNSVSDEKASINQHHSARNLQNTYQQQPTINAQQALGQQGILRISHQSTINQYIHPQDRIASSLPNAENLPQSFEYSSGQRIQSLADEILAKIQTQALNGESDNLNLKTHSRIISDGATSHQASLLADLERSTLASASGSQILHETQVSTGASVNQHLKTPYANYDFTHLL